MHDRFPLLTYWYKATLTHAASTVKEPAAPRHRRDDTVLTCCLCTYTDFLCIHDFCQHLQGHGYCSCCCRSSSLYNSEAVRHRFSHANIRLHMQFLPAIQTPFLLAHSRLAPHSQGPTRKRFFGLATVTVLSKVFMSPTTSSKSCSSTAPITRQRCQPAEPHDPP